MQRIYPVVESKICQACGKKFLRNKNLYGIAWVKTKYCSIKCFAKVDVARRKEVYKDETKHPRWKGNLVGYYGVHDWITKHYGQPKKCEVCGLDDPKRKYHWANMTNYLRDRKDWKRMCVSCHRLYDYGKRKLSGWSLTYPMCIKCKSTKVKYKARGMCNNCYMRKRYKNA